MSRRVRHEEPGRVAGIVAALAAAVLFGAGTPLAKLLLASVNPWLLAALLYLGSGIGLGIYRRVTNAPGVSLPRDEAAWLAGAVLCGGVLGPVLLMYGLTRMPASAASLLLNAEAVFTALLAWFAFKENVDRRVALGMLAIVAGAVVLTWPGEFRLAALWPALAVLGACLAWGVDNNLTRKVALADASWVAAIKGMAAGAVNLLLALSVDASLPPPGAVLATMLVGFFAYGVSLALFVVGLRHLGTARAGAYFSVAPFAGVALSLCLGEEPTVRLLGGGACMALGLWLHLSERHEHLHVHPVMEHSHEHAHDEHHDHVHGDAQEASGIRHTHWHRHEALTHSHPHFPDAHHRHAH